MSNFQAEFSGQWLRYKSTLVQVMAWCLHFFVSNPLVISGFPASRPNNVGASTSLSHTFFTLSIQVDHSVCDILGIYESPATNYVIIDFDTLEKLICQAFCNQKQKLLAYMNIKHIMQIISCQFIHSLVLPLNLPFSCIILAWFILLSLSFCVT